MNKQINKPVIMLKSSKSMISTTHDQLLNVIYKTQNCCYQHHHPHHYFNDLFYRCNNRKKQNKQPQIKRNRNKNKPKTKYLNEISCSSSKSNNDSSTISTTTKSFDNVCYCENHHAVGCSKEHFKSYKEISDYLRYIWLYFQKNFNNLQLVVVIFLLALIITTAHSIDTQDRHPQQNSTTSPSLFAEAISMPTKNLTVSLPCYHHILKALRTRANSTIEFKSSIYHNQRYIYQRNRYCRKIFKHLKNPLSHQSTHYKNSSKWLTNYKRPKFKIDTSNNEQIQTQIQYKEHDHHQQQHQDDSSVIIVDKQIQTFNFNTNVINFENNMAKVEDKENLRKINNSNINNKMLQQHIRTNNSFNKNNHNYNNIINNNNNKTNKLTNNTLTLNNKMLKPITTKTKKRENTNDIINDHVDVNVNDEDDDDHVDINISYTTSLNLLPVVNSTTTTTKVKTVYDDSFQSIDYSNHQQKYQHIDHNKLMKLVMDGLGLKKAPNMQTVNISQEEYVTKYREYLQRVHMRKRRELRDVLGEYDENMLRPLEIFSIVSSGTLQSHNEISHLRQKRNTVLGLNRDKEEEDIEHDKIDEYYHNEKKQSLEERVKNILLLKKKYQKPRSTKKERDERKTNIRLLFALKPEILNLTSSDIEEANIRLVLIHSPILAIRNSKNKKTHTKPKNNSCSSSRKDSQKNLYQVNVLNLKLYFISRSGKRVLLDGRKVDINVDLTKPDETHTQWLQFDVSKAVKTAVDDKNLQHVVLELQCDNCKRVGARILNDAYNTAADALADNSLTEGHQLMPILNIIGRFDQSHRSMRPHKYDNHHHSEYHEEATTQRHYHHHQTYNNNNNKNRHNNRRTNCYKANQRCCRHSMEVTFKEIKGFEFIIQPKVFDAGYCHGRCPPRYNPAHHHAMLQSLIWKQNHHKAPRPCCAPSKLVELEVLHVDEKDSEKLKISTWSDMKVVECACS